MDEIMPPFCDKVHSTHHDTSQVSEPPTTPTQGGPEPTGTHTHDDCADLRDVRLKDVCPSCVNRFDQALNPPLETPVRHLLSKTERRIPGSDAEEIQVHEVISAAEKRIQELDEARRRVEFLLQHISDERQKVVDFADDHRVLVAPVWELPPELLSYIFLLAMPPDPPEMNRLALKASLLMSQINQHWRSVAITTPQLWTLLILDNKSFPPKPNTLSMAHLCFQRSGACPLSISIVSKDYNESMLQFITPLADRWKRISFDMPVSMLKALSSLQGQLPNLRTVELKNMLWYDRDVPAPEPDSPNYLQLFHKAPSLRHFSSTCPFQESFRILPLNQLASWDSPARIPDFSRIFDLAPNLVECFLIPMRPAMGNQSVLENNLQLHNLTSLHISTGAFTNFSLQLQHLPRFTSLRRLFLYYDKHVNIPLTDDNLIKFFEQSASNLEHLTFAISVVPAVINHCLHSAKNLTSLHLHRLLNEVVLGQIQEMTYTHGSETHPFLPHLKVLCLSGKIYFPAAAVTKIIKARWSGETGVSTEGKCLEEVHVWSPRHDKFDLEEKKELLSFGEKGFGIHIRQLDRVAFLAHRTPYTTID